MVCDPIVSSTIVAELKLTETKGAEVLDYFRQHCDDMDEKILNAKTISKIYDAIVNQRNTSEGRTTLIICKNLTPLASFVFTKYLTAVACFEFLLSKIHKSTQPDDLYTFYFQF